MCCQKAITPDLACTIFVQQVRKKNWGESEERKIIQLENLYEKKVERLRLTLPVRILYEPFAAVRYLEKHQLAARKL